MEVKMKNLFKTEQKGRSMIEMLGVLAIIGVLSVGGISGYSKAMAKFKLTKAQDQISMLLINIRTAFATSPSYLNLNNSNAVKLNIVPGDMLPGGLGTESAATAAAGSGGILNAFGGSVEITATGANSAHFSIKYNGLGRETCVSLASSDWGTDGLYSMTVKGSKEETFNAAQGDLPISAIEALSYCSNSTANSITWEYY